MYEPVKFKRLRELASELNTKLEALTNGELSKDELENMTDHSRELYERLVVLRFKAYDGEVREKSIVAEAEPVREIVETPVSIPFKIDEPAPVNQVSLIDAIEEVTRKVTSEPEPVISLAEPEAQPAVDIKRTEMHATISEVKTLEGTERTVHVRQESLHERLARGMNASESLGKRLEHNPISDLKRAISLNQRFQFSKELFKGNNQDYEMAIDKLNTSEREEAMKHLNNLRSKYAWNNESTVTHDFVNLVERRHQF